MRTPHLRRCRVLGRHLVSLLILCAVAVVGAGASHTIVVQSDPPRAATLFGAGEYEPGQPVQVTVLPARGFTFSGWFEDGREISPSPTFEFTADRDRVLVARLLPGLDLVGVAGSSQGSMILLPSFALGSHRLEVRPQFLLGTHPWDVRLVAAFTGENWRDAQAHFTGSLDTVRFGGGVLFNPVGPAYRSAYFMASSRWDELHLGLRVTHYPLSGSPPAPYLLYVLTLSASNLWATLRGEERDGLEFKDALINLFGIDVCCGIQANATLSFTKDGFSRFRTSVTDLPLGCCGLSFDLAVTYTTDSKSLDFAPRWAPWCDACLTVYGDVLWDRSDSSWNGFALYGFKIRCCFGDSYIEFLTAFDPSRVPGGFQGEEFEYVKFGTCGPGCCGGRYSLDATVYFAPEGLFGFSRLKITAGIPLFVGTTVSSTLEIAAAGQVMLSLTWQIRF